jgi:hypothetical protein
MKIMKKLMALMLLTGMIIFISCGPNKEEQRKKATNDSIAKADSIAKIEKKKADSLAEIKKQKLLLSEECKEYDFAFYQPAGMDMAERDITFTFTANSNKVKFTNILNFMGGVKEKFINPYEMTNVDNEYKYIVCKVDSGTYTGTFKLKLSLKNKKLILYDHSASDKNKNIKSEWISK